MRTRSHGADTLCTASDSSPPVLTTSILDAAFDWAGRGFPVVPLNPGSKSPWRRPKGYKKLPNPTEADIRGWFAVEPRLNIGIHTGGNLIVIDVDEKPGKMSGSRALAALEAIYGPLTPTLTSITGGGGRQLFFYLPPGYGPFGNRLPVVAEWLWSHPEADSGGVIDIRNDGLVVLPPSIHPNGTPYRWEDPTFEIATLPIAWCEEPVKDPERRRTRRRKPASHLAPTDLDRRDAIAHERLGNVDPNALLGKDTLLLLEAEVEKSTDRSHRMYQIILGAASVRFDMDRLYDLMVNSPLKAGLRKHGGREWFDQNVFEAHQYLAENILAVEEIRAADEEFEWTSTQIEPGRKVSGQAMREVFQEALDIAVQQASLEPILDKHKIANSTNLSRMTVFRAMKGLAMLGRLEVVPEPEKPFDFPFKYRLLPPQSWLAGPTTGPVAGCSASGHALRDPNPGSTPVSCASSVPLTSPCLLYVSGGNQEGIASEGSKDLLGESRDTPGPPTVESAAEVLRNFEDAPEPARTKKKIDPWATHACRKCGQPTLSMRDPDTDPDRVFRVDAQPSPTGNYVIVDDRWAVLQGEGRTNYERAHDETERKYYAWHRCSIPPQRS